MIEPTIAELATGFVIRKTNADGSVTAIAARDMFFDDPQDDNEHRAPDAFETWAEGLIDE